MKTKTISKAEAERIHKKFPRCPVAKFQAGGDEWFQVEWVDGERKPTRLVHHFRPIFG